jgi:hypothetical protein
MTVDFERMYWQDYPSHATPINAENLNRLEEGVAGLYADVSKGILFFKDQPVLATTGDICTISNSKITANHVVTEAVWGDSSKITTDVTWTTSAGYLRLNGTCSGATTVTITLAEKQN